MSALVEIGNAVRTRRTEMGLTQEALARLSKLSRSTVNAVERHSVGNLSIAKVESLLEAIGLSMSVAPAETPAAKRRSAPARSALERAASTASVSYGPAMTGKQLEEALVSGDAPPSIQPHVQALLDETPISLLAKVVEELHVKRNVERAEIWRRMRHLAHQLKCYREIWW